MHAQGTGTGLANATPTVLIPIRDGSVAVSADDAGDLLCYWTVRGRLVPDRATRADLRMEMGHLLARHGMRGLREAVAECASLLRSGDPEDVADVRIWRAAARGLSSAGWLAVAR